MRLVRSLSSPAAARFHHACRSRGGARPRRAYSRHSRRGRREDQSLPAHLAEMGRGRQAVRHARGPGMPGSRHHRRGHAARSRQCQVRFRRYQEFALPAQPRRRRRRSRAVERRALPRRQGLSRLWRRRGRAGIARRRGDTRRQVALAGGSGRHRDGISRGRRAWPPRRRSGRRGGEGPCACRSRRRKAPTP